MSPGILETLAQIPIWVYGLIVLLVVLLLVFFKMYRRVTRRRTADVVIEDYFPAPAAIVEVGEDSKGGVKEAAVLGTRVPEAMITRYPNYVIEERPDGPWLHTAFRVDPKWREDIDRLAREQGRGARPLALSYRTVIVGDSNMEGDMALPSHTMFVSIALAGRGRAADVSAERALRTLVLDAYKSGKAIAPLPGYLYAFGRLTDLGTPDLRPVKFTDDALPPGFDLWRWLDIIQKSATPEEARGAIAEQYPGAAPEGELVEEFPQVPIVGEGVELEIPEKPSFGGVSEERTEGVEEPARLPVGFAFESHRDVFFDLESETENGGYIYGPSGSGKSYFVGKVIESILERGETAVIILDPTIGHTGLIAPNSTEIMGKKEKESLRWFYENLQYAPRFRGYPVKVFLVGSRDEQLAYDELFTVDVNEMRPEEIMAAVFAIGAEKSLVQQSYLSIAIDSLKEEGKEQYNLEDIREKLADFMYPEKERKYEKLKKKYVLRKFRSETISSLATKINELLKALPETFVRSGGTVLENEVKPGQATIIHFSPKIRTDREKLDCIASFVLRKISQAYGPDAPVPEERKGLCYAVFLEESHNFCPRDRMTESSKLVDKLVKEGRKYGISPFLVTQSPKDFSRDVQENCRLLQVMFPPEPKQKEAVGEYYAREHWVDIDRVLGRLGATTGACVVSGRGTNVDEWAAVLVPPRSSRHSPIRKRDEWREARKMYGVEARRGPAPRARAAPPAGAAEELRRALEGT